MHGNREYLLVGPQCSIETWPLAAEGVGIFLSHHARNSDSWRSGCGIGRNGCALDAIQVLEVFDFELLEHEAAILLTIKHAATPQEQAIELIRELCAAIGDPSVRCLEPVESGLDKGRLIYRRIS